MLLELLGSFKKYFFKSILKVLRMLLRLSVSGVLFQKAGPLLMQNQFHTSYSIFQVYNWKTNSFENPK